MFYDKVMRLCARDGITISKLVAGVGLSKSNATYWKNGAIPKIITIKKVAEYFNVPIESLLDDTQMDHDLLAQGFSLSDSPSLKKTVTLDEQEDELLTAFRNLSKKCKALALARIYELEEEQNK